MISLHVSLAWSGYERGAADPKSKSFKRAALSTPRGVAVSPAAIFQPADDLDQFSRPPSPIDLVRL
jgi:hypothetical protein